MRHTSITDYNGNQTYPGTVGFTLVWSGTYNINGDGFYNIILNTAFNYNGTDILEVLFENESGHLPWDDLWFDRTDASTTIFNGKFGAGWNWNGAKGNNTKRHFNLAIGLNTIDMVDCRAFETTLPIVLQDFTVEKDNECVNIDWTTLSESNNDYFEIQRSKESENFEAIGVIDGAENSNIALNYKYIDNKPLDGTSYYRLKQVDFNGDFSYSEIANISYGIISQQIESFPNPANNEVSFIFPSLYNEEVELLIYDITGKTIINQKKDAIIGENLFLYNISFLEKGFYFISINGNHLNCLQKFIKE